MSFTIILRAYNKECISLSTREQGFLCVSSEVKIYLMTFENNVVTKEIKGKIKVWAQGVLLSSGFQLVHEL